jgi:Lrp/AsnC family leucine-responsive transcriptional regulator
MKQLTKREKQVLVELLKNARVSDQTISKKLGTSRPTIAKIRKRLEQRGYIKGYATYTDFTKVGLTVNAVILFRWIDYTKQTELKKNTEFVKGLPEVIMFIKGEGMGSKTDLIISVHEDLKSFEIFIRKLKEKWGPDVTDVEVFLSSIEGIHKRYDISHPIINRLSKYIGSQ